MMFDTCLVHGDVVEFGVTADVVEVVVTVDDRDR